MVVRSSRTWRRALRPVGLLPLAIVAAELGLRVLLPQIHPMLPPGLVTKHAGRIDGLTPGFHSRFTRAEFDTTVQVNDAGVRGPALSPRRANTFRILALGNADTFGFGVNADETYAARLEAILSSRHPHLHVEVVNAGVPGYGTVDELLWLRERGPSVDPDLILVQFMSYSDFAINGESPLVTELLDDGADAAGAEHAGPPTAVRQSLPTRVRGAVHALKSRSHLVTLLSDVTSYSLMRLVPSQGLSALWGEEFTTEEAARTRKLLVLIASDSVAMGVPTVLIYATGKAQVIGRHGLVMPSEAVVAAAATEAGVPWINMTEELRKHADRRGFFFWRDAHWTVAGHQAVANVLADRLSTLNLIP